MKNIIIIIQHEGYHRSLTNSLTALGAKNLTYLSVTQCFMCELSPEIVKYVSELPGVSSVYEDSCYGLLP